MKKELTLILKEKIGECEIDVETIQGNPARIDVYFREYGCSGGFYQFEDYQLGMLAEFFSKAYNEVKKLNG